MQTIVYQTTGPSISRGTRGILAINPQKVITNPNRPPVYVTSLLINSQEDPEGLPTYQELLPLQYNNNITLKASQGNITIRYSALNFIHSEDNSYAFTRKVYLPGDKLL